jgi:hypothetical protein
MSGSGPIQHVATGSALGVLAGSSGSDGSTGLGAAGHSGPPAQLAVPGALSAGSGGSNSDRSDAGGPVERVDSSSQEDVDQHLPAALMPASEFAQRVCRVPWLTTECVGSSARRCGDEGRAFVLWRCRQRRRRRCWRGLGRSHLAWQRGHGQRPRDGSRAARPVVNAGARADLCGRAGACGIGGRSGGTNTQIGCRGSTLLSCCAACAAASDCLLLGVPRWTTSSSR